MKQIYEAQKLPTLHLTVNKSRLKLYSKNTDIPTYYLQKGQEFQLELFNPTSNTILAKIKLNGNLISQGGLVINPGQRIFLERYLDIAKKFLFDTYEVSNTSEVKKAIEENGDIHVEFYREMIKFDYTWLTNNINQKQNYFDNSFTYLDSTLSSLINVGSSDIKCFYNSSLNNNDELIKSKLLKNRSKKIETGRVEEGSDSNQILKSVSKNFELIPFHIIDYKVLPISQKINTINDTKVRLYCTSCGKKIGENHKYCAFCGTKI